ncbi:hypothetical protein H4219_005198, partial [Mycoemilia scoparia]
GIAKCNSELQYKSLKRESDAYLEVFGDVIENITKIMPQDLQVDDSRCMYYDNSNNNNGNSIVVVDDQAEGKEKILTFIREHLFERANSVIKLYMSVEGNDKQALYNELNACHGASTVGTGEPADGFTMPQGKVTRNSSPGLIEKFFNNFIQGIEDNKELEKWW